MIWLSGRLIEAETPALTVGDRGFTLADGLFETLRVRNGTPGLWKLHVERLKQGLQILGLKLPISVKNLHAAVQQTLEANRRVDAAVRISLSAGPAPRGLARPAKPEPTLLITAAPLPPPSKPVVVTIARSTRRNELSPLAQVKTSAAYPDQLLALREAQTAKADDALVLNTRGRLTGATTANLILCRGSRALTPSVAEGALPGTIRRWLLDKAEIEEAALQAETLRPTDTLLLVNALGVRRASLLGAPEPEIAPSAERVFALLNAEIFD